MNSEQMVRSMSSLSEALGHASNNLTFVMERFERAVARVEDMTQPANRIGSACWYQLAGPGITPMKWRAGILRAWSTDWDQPNKVDDSDESDESIALFPVAVIEDGKTGQCHSIYVTRVCFAAIPPS